MRGAGAIDVRDKSKENVVEKKKQKREEKRVFHEASPSEPSRKRALVAVGENLALIGVLDSVAGKLPQMQVKGMMPSVGDQFRLPKVPSAGGQIQSTPTTIVVPEHGQNLMRKDVSGAVVSAKAQAPKTPLMGLVDVKVLVS